MRFDSFDTENYCYKTLKELGIRHVCWSSNAVVTKDDIDQLRREVTGEDFCETEELESEPFYEFP